MSTTLSKMSKNVIIANKLSTSQLFKKLKIFLEYCLFN